MIRRSMDIHSMPEREINTNITFFSSLPQHFHDDGNLRHERHPPTNEGGEQQKGERTTKTFNSLLDEKIYFFSPWFRFFKFSFPFRSHRCCSLFRFVLLLLKFIRCRKYYRIRFVTLWGNSVWKATSRRRNPSINFSALKLCAEKAVTLSWKKKSAQKSQRGLHTLQLTCRRLTLVVLIWLKIIDFACYLVSFDASVV